MLSLIAQTGWDTFLASIKYPPGSMFAILAISITMTIISTILTRLSTNPKQLKEKQAVIKAHQDRRKEIEELKDERPKKYKKELTKWERMDKPIQTMKSKMGLQRMKPMLFTCIPYMIIFPIIGGFFNGPVAIPPMNPYDIPLIGQMMHGILRHPITGDIIIPASVGMIGYMAWYVLCSFTSNMIISRLAGTQQAGGGLGQMFDQAKYDSYKT
jgi:uncharacterized membrane protein (DUF106 family)